MTRSRYIAAWVPDDDPHRPWDEASSRVVEWVDARAEELGADPVLVTNTHGDAPVDGFTWGQDWFSSRSSGRARKRPVFSYVPGLDEFDYALGIARGAAIGVVESVDTPLGGWAAEVGALNLWTGEVTPAHTQAVQELLKRLTLHGNNGFGDELGKKTAPRLVDDLVATGEIKPASIPAALAAHNVSVRGQKRIAAIVERARPPRPWSAPPDW